MVSFRKQALTTGRAWTGRDTSKKEDWKQGLINLNGKGVKVKMEMGKPSTREKIYGRRFLHTVPVLKEVRQMGSPALT